MSGANLLVIVTGSIAAYKACEVVSQLVQQGHRVKIVATESSLKFVGTATWEGLTGERVLSDLFEPGAALEHIQLTRWADAVLLCPATANTLNRLAAGLADDLTGALFLAHDREKPFLAAPAMNPAMWSHPATVAAVARLTEWGMTMLEVGAGRTACGETGEGRLAEPAQIVAAVASVLAPPGRRLRVLVTSGGTAEPIDGVRFISNQSSGQTGAGIARHFAERGHEVVLLRAGGSAAAPAGVRTEEFVSCADLAALFRRWLQAEAFDAVIHAAAVGDFSVNYVVVDGAARPPGGAKLSSASPPTLFLRENPKLVESLRELSCNPAIQVVAFKLTAGATEEAAAEAVTELTLRSGAELVVHNDLAQRQAGGAFPADLYGPGGVRLAHCSDRAELSRRLEEFLAVSSSAPASHAALS